jgi:hypothetical protein
MAEFEMRKFLKLLYLLISVWLRRVALGTQLVTENARLPPTGNFI